MPVVKGAHGLMLAEMRLLRSLAAVLRWVVARRPNGQIATRGGVLLRGGPGCMRRAFFSS